MRIWRGCAVATSTVLPPACTRMLPRSHRYVPKIIFRIELLPAPDRPASTAHSPARTANATPLTTGRRTPPCKCMVNVFATAVSSSTVDMTSSRRQDRGHQQLRVWLGRIRQHLVGEAGLDDLAILHHYDPMR